MLSEGSIYCFGLALVDPLGPIRRFEILRFHGETFSYVPAAQSLDCSRGKKPPGWTMKGIAVEGRSN